jgi:predicted PurR-regulated permease PerM
VMVVVLAMAAALWLLYKLEGVILLIILSTFFAYLIAPLVERLCRPMVINGRQRRMPRAAAIGIVYIAVFGTSAVTASALVPLLGRQITEFGQQAPALMTHARDRMQAWRYLFDPQQLPPALRDAVETSAARTLEGVGAYVNATLSGLLGALVVYLPWFVLIPILAFFLLKDADAFHRSVLLALPGDRLRWRGAELSAEINSTLAAYIRAALSACLLIGVVCTIGFLIIGLPYALLLGLFAGLLEFIPLVGPLTVAVGATLIASFYSPGQAVAVLLFLGVLRVVQDYVIFPRLIGRGIHLHPLDVILAILCGAELAGVAGIFLAIPAVAVLSVVYRHWTEYRGGVGLFTNLMAPSRVPPTASHD